MKSIKLTDDIKCAAARCIWFESVEKAIRIPERFAAYVLTYGAVEDVAALRAQLDDGDLTEVLAKAPAGIFDARSWAYWHLMTGAYDPPPLPERNLS